MSDDHCYVKGQTGLSAHFFKYQERMWLACFGSHAQCLAQWLWAGQWNTCLAQLGSNTHPPPKRVLGVQHLLGRQDHRNPLNDIYKAGLLWGMSLQYLFFFPNSLPLPCPPDPNLPNWRAYPGAKKTTHTFRWFLSKQTLAPPYISLSSYIIKD